MLKTIVLIFFIINCIKDTNTKPIPIIEETIQVEFNGSIQNIPKEIEKETYNFRVRFYNCPSTDFGKKNYDTGSFSYKEEDCRKNFYEEIFTSKGLKYQQKFIVPKKWTHGFIELMGLKLISGMYSPGENPFWIKNNNHNLETDAGLVFSNNFEFETMENPIPDAEQETISNKFSPIIVLKKDKKFIPTNLEKYYRNYTIEEMTEKQDSKNYEMIDIEKDKFMSFDETLYGKGSTFLYYHVRPEETFVSGTSQKALPGWRDNRNYRYSKNKGNIVISYYLWYDFNEGPSPLGNKHEGDFESFSILIDQKGTPLRFMVTGHNHVMLDTKWSNINSIQNHPIIYIAHGRNSDGGNPTSPYGGYAVGLEAGNAIFNLLADPQDIFPEINEESQLILPNNLDTKLLQNIRIGPGEWVDPNLTKYVDGTRFVSRKIEKLVKWEEPGWINKVAYKDPDKNHNVPEESAFYQNFGGRLGKHTNSKLMISKLSQWGKSPVNVPFKMNDEQHFTFERPHIDRCEKARIGDYCEKFKGDDKTPQ
jgi:hypothetical protein